MGVRNAGGEQPCGAGAEWHEPQDRNMEAGVENGRRIRAHGIKGGVAQIEEAGMAHNEVQAEAEDGIQTHIIENIDPVGIEKSRQDGETRRKRHGKQGFVRSRVFIPFPPPVPPGARWVGQ